MLAFYCAGAEVEELLHRRTYSSPPVRKLVSVGAAPWQPHSPANAQSSSGVAKTTVEACLQKCGQRRDLRVGLIGASSSERITEV